MLRTLESGLVSSSTGLGGAAAGLPGGSSRKPGLVEVKQVRLMLMVMLMLMLMLRLMLMLMLMLMFLRYSPYSLPNFNSGAAMAAGLSGAHQVHPQVGLLLTYKLTLP